MRIFQGGMQLFQFFWMIEGQRHQRLAWDDAAKMRYARIATEIQAAAQLEAMRHANPSGALGDSKIDNAETLKRSGLL